MLRGSAATPVVADSLTRAPLPKASVFDRNGDFVGVSADNGAIPSVSSLAYPLSVRYMGYNRGVIPSSGTDTIFMAEDGYELPELVVESKKSDVLRLKAYVREYSSITTYTDTVLLFREKTVDFMVPVRRGVRFKGWLNPRVLASRSYYHFSDAQGLDSVSAHFGGYFSWSDWVGVTEVAEVPASISGRSVATDTIFGRYGLSSTWRRSGENLYVDVDVLADTLNRSWTPSLAPFFNNGLDLRRLNMRWVFTDVNSDKVYASNLARLSFDIESKGRGRNLQRFFRTADPVYVDTHAEIYVVERVYMSEADARRCEKDPFAGEEVLIAAPDDAPELQPAVKMIVERVENIDYDALRLGEKPDKRYAGIKNYGKIEKGGFLKYLKSLIL